MGEMGDLFAQAFLKSGYPVYPVLRGMNPGAIARKLPDPELVLVAIGENGLQRLLGDMPTPWRGRLALIQNELLPHDWQRHGISDPTVVVVWFDKKKGRPFVSVLPTRVCGPQAALVVGALKRIEVPCFEVGNNDLLYELVNKNLYILTVNIAGLRLEPGATVGELWTHNRALVERLASEILDIQQALTECELPRDRLMAGLLEGFQGDLKHICRGRSAPERLQRAVANARRLGLAVPALQEIAAATGNPSP
jgi:hypothetical protein